MTKITRFGVTFPPELLKDFDEITKKMGMRAAPKPFKMPLGYLLPRENGYNKTKLSSRQELY